MEPKHRAAIPAGLRAILQDCAAASGRISPYPHKSLVVLPSGYVGEITAQSNHGFTVKTQEGYIVEAAHDSVTELSGRPWQSFQPGDRVWHKWLGEGEVVSHGKTTRVRVLFNTDAAPCSPVFISAHGLEMFEDAVMDIDF